MVGFSATSVFTAREVDLLAQARRVVEALPDDPKLRCHEVARIVRAIVGQGKVEDGTLGESRVDHSWIVLGHAGPRQHHVLDPYAVGRLPVVQLVEVGFPLDNPYRPGPPRTDLRAELVVRMVEKVRRALAGTGSPAPSARNWRAEVRCARAACGALYQVRGKDLTPCMYEFPNEGHCRMAFFADCPHCEGGTVVDPRAVALPYEVELRGTRWRIKMNDALRSAPKRPLTPTAGHDSDDPQVPRPERPRGRLPGRDSRARPGRPGGR